MRLVQLQEHQETGNYQIFAGYSGISHDETLKIEDTKIQWIAGGKIQKTISVETQGAPHKFHAEKETICDCVWTDFPELPTCQTRRFIAVLQPHLLKLHGVDGSQYSVHVPGVGKSLVRLPEGLLVVLDAHTSSNDPLLFSLLHPLEDLKPVSFHNAQSYVTDCEEEIVFTSTAQPYLVTWHHTKKVHRIYVIRQSKKEMNKRLRVEEQLTQMTQLAPPPSNAMRVEPRTPPMTPILRPPKSRRLNPVLETDSVDSDVISSELFLENVWTEESSHSERARRIFLSSDAESNPLICFYYKADSSIKMFQICSTELDNTFSQQMGRGIAEAMTQSSQGQKPISLKEGPEIKDVVDAIPIRSDRNVTTESHYPTHSPRLREDEEVAAYDYDILVLNRNSDLCLFTGGEFVTKISEDFPFTVKELKDPVCNRFTILCTDEKMYRMELKRFSDCLRVNYCLQALQVCLPKQIYHKLRQDWIKVLKAKEWESDWEAFEALMFHVADVRKIEIPESAVPTTASESDDHWQLLLDSSMHESLKNDVAFRSLKYNGGPRILSETAPPSTQMKIKTEHFNSYLFDILNQFHLVYENFKLHTLLSHHLEPLSRMLYQLSVRLGATTYGDYYVREHGHLFTPGHRKESTSRKRKREDDQPEARTREPPNIYNWVTNRIRGNSIDDFPLPPNTNGLHSNSGPFDFLQKIIYFYDVLTESTHFLQDNNFNSFMTDRTDHSGSIQLFLDSPTHSNAGDLSMSMSVPFSTPIRKESIREPKEAFPFFSPSIYAIDKPEYEANNNAQRLVIAMAEVKFTLNDLECVPFGIALPIMEALRSCRDNPPDNWKPIHYDLIRRQDLSRKNVDINGGTGSNLSGLTQSFLKDDLEDSGAAGDGGTSLVVESSSLLFGKDLRLDEVRRLLRSDAPIQVKIPHDLMAETLQKARKQTLLYQFVKRNFSLPVGRGMFTMCSINPLLTQKMEIPELSSTGRWPPRDALVKLDYSFLAGLTGFDSDFEESSFQNWPNFHNGCAQGLRCFMKDSEDCKAKSIGTCHISRNWIAYNRPEEVTYEHAGLIMAMGLLGHMKEFSIPDIYRYLKTRHPAIAISILLGIGISNIGTKQKKLWQILCIHIPSMVPGGFNDLEISIGSQAAALLSAGFLYLGSSWNLVSQMLVNEIGRRVQGDSCDDRECYSLCAGFGLGLVNLGKGTVSSTVSDLDLDNRLATYINGGRDWMSSGANYSLQLNGGAESNQSSRIKEGNMVNIGMTSPGATMALALIFLKSNNQTVADRLVIPTTHFRLDYVRPDFLMLRIIARNLIMWDSVEPTDEWLQGQIPDIIKQVNSSTTVPNPGLDQVALSQTYVNIIAGCCFSLGLRFAGTRDRRAAHLITRHLRHLEIIRPKGVLRSGHVDKSTRERVLATTAIALAMVMAGSGHLETFKLLRNIRMPVDKDISYGHQMALNSAIGLLFLGGGRMTLSRSNLAIASLLIAFYPKWPKHTCDNQYHLQACRHLYTLAVESRFVQTIDADLNVSCWIPIKIDLRETEDFASTTLSAVTPCILPEFHLIKRIRIDSPRYFTQVLDLASNREHMTLVRESGTILVKRKVGNLPYNQDPNGQKGILSRCFPKPRIDAFMSEDEQELFMKRLRRNQNDFLRAFPSDTNILAFAKHFCADSSPISSFCTSVLYECLTQKKSEMIDTYIRMWNIVDDLPKSIQNPTVLLNFQLILKYYEFKPTNSIFESLDSILNRSFLLRAEKRVSSYLDKKCDSDLMCAYFQGGFRTAYEYLQQKGVSADETATKMGLLGKLLLLLKFPSYNELETIFHYSAKLAKRLENQEAHALLNSVLVGRERRVTPMCKSLLPPILACAIDACQRKTSTQSDTASLIVHFLIDDS